MLEFQRGKVKAADHHWDIAPVPSDLFPVT